ncbi:MAG: hypothetical protein Q7S22_06665 [Candidatus Micrarchaeota archaeon]|nr:hypothetical protein [Candidatus Micrarchaeota archaeon]
METKQKPEEIIKKGNLPINLQRDLESQLVRDTLGTIGVNFVQGSGTGEFHPSMRSAGKSIYISSGVQAVRGNFENYSEQMPELLRYCLSDISQKEDKKKLVPKLATG